MSKLIVMNEKATYCATKIYVNGERLSRSKDKNRKIDTEYKMIQEVELDPGIKEIYLKYTFVSTKPVKIELKEDIDNGQSLETISDFVLACLCPTLNFVHKDDKIEDKIDEWIFV